MRFWTDYSKYQHDYKKREVDIIFAKCPERLFPKVLELGAGDGYQASLLIKHVSKLISTELNPLILKNENTESIEYRICNAEEVGKIFNTKEFDLIFSSNLLEHLSNPRRALSGVYEILKDDGITIHIMPNPFWKFCHLLFYLPNRFLIVLERLSQKGRISSVSKEDKIRIARKPFIHRALTLKPHGASNSNIKEFFTFTKHRWIREFEKANLELVRVIKGPVHSGYGFGLGILRNIMEKIGFSSEYVYIAIKKGKESYYRQYFERI